MPADTKPFSDELAIFKLHLRGSFKKFAASPRKRHCRKTFYALFFNIVSLSFNALGPPMFKHCYPIAEEDCILVLQILLQGMDDFIIASTMLTTQMWFELRNPVWVGRFQVRWVRGMRQQFKATVGRFSNCHLRCVDRGIVLEQHHAHSQLPSAFPHSDFPLVTPSDFQMASPAT